MLHNTLIVNIDNNNYYYLDNPGISHGMNIMSLYAM